MTDAHKRIEEALGHWEQKLVGYIESRASNNPEDERLNWIHADQMLGAARDQLAFALTEALIPSSSSKDQT